MASFLASDFYLKKILIESNGIAVALDERLVTESMVLVVLREGGFVVINVSFAQKFTLFALIINRTMNDQEGRNPSTPPRTPHTAPVSNIYSITSLSTLPPLPFLY